MGAIGNDELKKLENMQMASSLERILVLVRLRPLNEKEITANEAADWECINDNTILYRNTLREGSTFPSAYTFDRVFRGDCSTRQVYEDGAKEIALSAVMGINSSIFAYGQTSSGKTYTMTGITEFAVADIFDYINKHEERAFVLKFSAIEIYNEAIRDLLSTDNTTPLRLRDDPEKGTIVEKITEEVLRDQNHLKELLSTCEDQRRIGETSLNEKSSRSHQIIRLVVESSAHEFLGKDNSTTLAASVNFVDLAGSERASQALSSGARLKEGCHINRSLLTLSTVVRKLSNGRHGHINYRDSKLTRLLQPCLGGNARTAIVCTLSPARSHVEQTRNTLLFACCAKEVTTKAQVNVVMSDKALVKHLQKELARLENELKAPVPSSNCDYVALLRKKDLQIQKMEKEIRELTKQRDLAQSRVEDLLKVIDRGQVSGELTGRSHLSNGKISDSWEDDCAGSHTSDSVDCTDVDTRLRKLNKAQLYDTNSETNVAGSYHLHTSRDNNDDSLSNDVPDDYCREVRCIKMEEGRDNELESHTLGTGIGIEIPESTQYGDGDEMHQQRISTPINGNGDRTGMRNGFTYQVLVGSVQHSIDSPVSADESPSPVLRADVSSSTKMNLTRSWSCREDANTEASSFYEGTGFVERTPPNGLEVNFTERPKGYPRKLWSLNNGAKNGILSRSNSQSSLESSLMEGSRGVDGMKSSADEDITSIHTFVEGLKKQLAEGQVEGTGKNLKDVGVGPMLEAADSLPNWPLEFEKLQKAIIELWQACHVSLVHRTYFFLLFKGDPSDSIYMEVELRRLSFLNDTLSQGNVATEDGQTLTLASSVRALRRERGMLSKLMRKRLSEEERLHLFQRWGISVNSKQRRLQLVNHLWSNAKDIDHVTESAAIVAKLIRFVEQGLALKQMFGLSFTPPRSRRRSFGWKNSMSTLL